MTVVVGVAIAVAGFAIIFSLSAAVDFKWHLDSLERLLWVPSLLALRESGWLVCDRNGGCTTTDLHERRVG